MSFNCAPTWSLTPSAFSAPVTPHYFAETTSEVHTPSLRSAALVQQCTDVNWWLQTPRKKCSDIFPKLFWHGAWLRQNSSPPFCAEVAEPPDPSLSAESRWTWRTLPVCVSHLSDLPFGAWQLISSFIIHFSALLFFLTGLQKCQPQVCTGWTDGMSML